MNFLVETESTWAIGVGGNGGSRFNFSSCLEFGGGLKMDLTAIPASDPLNCLDRLRSKSINFMFYLPSSRFSTVFVIVTTPAVRGIHDLKNSDSARLGTLQRCLL